MLSNNGLYWLLYYLIRVLHVDQFLSDKFYLTLQYRCLCCKRLNLSEPKSYNEKLLWLKLYNRRSEYSVLVDKFAVKDYVSKRIGNEYVIPTLGVWDRAESIDWDKLPSKFVLKCTHDSGSFILCRDKEGLNKDKVIKKLNKCLSCDYYKLSREWPYKFVPHRIIAEKFIEVGQELNDLPDYKFFCFDGVVKALFVATERGSGDVKFDYFDENWNHLDLIQEHPMSGKDIPMPDNFEKMKELASSLSKGLPHVRIDLYNVDGRIYFGEYTFFHHGGVIPFHPDKWDYIFGSWISLPNKGS